MNFTSKEMFFHYYANLPLKKRRDIACVLKGNGFIVKITWNKAYYEIHSNTELGKKIEGQIIKAKII